MMLRESSVSRAMRLASRLGTGVRAHILSLVILATVVPTISLSVFNYFELGHQIRNSHRDLLVSVAQETARQVGQWLQEQEETSAAFAHTSDLLQNWTSLSSKNPASDDYFLDLFRLHREIGLINESSRWITEVRIADIAGKTVISDNNEALQTDFLPMSPKTLEAVRAGRTDHTDVYLEQALAPSGADSPELSSGFPTIMISAPIRNESRISGILSCRLAVGDLGSNFPTEAYSQPLEIYLTTPDGTVVSANRRAGQGGSKLRVPPESTWPRGGDDMEGYVDRAGTRVISGWAEVPNLNLVVMVLVPLASVLAPLHAALATTLAICVTLSILFAIIAYRRAGLLLAPLRVLTAAAYRLSLGDRTVRVQMKGQDEFGRLGQTFDNMAATLETTLFDIEQARDQALAATRAKSRFLSNMTHELRTPLNAVIGYSEMIMAEARDRPPESEQLCEDLEVIRSSGQHLLALINEILDLSKIEAGKMSVTPEEFDLDTLLQEVTTTVVPLVANQGNVLETDRSESMGTVWLDRMKLKQMLLNLLSNACKFTRDGKIGLWAKHDGDNLQLEVTDTGIGMSADQQKRIFDEFGQAEDTTARKYGGTGLGLTIVKRLAEMMEGSIAVRSELGHGSTFTLTLPRRMEIPGERSPGIQAS